MNAVRIIGASAGTVLMFAIVITFVMSISIQTGVEAVRNDSVSYHDIRHNFTTLDERVKGDLRANMSDAEYATVKTQLILIDAATATAKRGLAFGYHHPAVAAFYVHYYRWVWLPIAGLWYWPKVQKIVRRLRP